MNPGNTRLLEVTTDPLPSGRYRVYWSVIARDGHRTEGDFPFRVPSDARGHRGPL